MGGDVVDVDVDGVEHWWWQTKKEMRKDGSTPALDGDQR